MIAKNAKAPEGDLEESRRDAKGRLGAMIEGGQALTRLVQHRKGEIERDSARVRKALQHRREQNGISRAQIEDAARRSRSRVEQTQHDLQLPASIGNES